MENRSHTPCLRKKTRHGLRTTIFLPFPLPAENPDTSLKSRQQKDIRVIHRTECTSHIVLKGHLEMKQTDASCLFTIEPPDSPEVLPKTLMETSKLLFGLLIANQFSL